MLNSNDGKNIMTYVYKLEERVRQNRERKLVIFFLGMALGSAVEFLVIVLAGMPPWWKG